jgi:hypothetical protein
MPRKNHKSQWMEKLREFEQFMALNGRFPAKGNNPSERSLWYWRETQRFNHSQGKLSPDRLNLLSRTGILNTSFEIEWQKSFDSLTVFIEKNRRMPVKKADNKHEISLAMWRFRQQELLKAGKLPENKAVLLKNALLDKTARDNRWERNFEALKSFIKIHNRNPRCHQALHGERKLGKWLDYNKTLLDTRRENYIESIKAFIKRKKRLPRIGSRSSHERSLYTWTLKMRKIAAAGRLKEAEAMVLEELGVLKARKRAAWFEHYKEFYKFLKENAHNPHRNSIDPRERSLAGWHMHQIELRRKDKLPEERARLLRVALTGQFRTGLCGCRVPRVHISFMA